MNGGLELKPKSLDELFRQYMANSGTQEQSQISPMDYLNMDDGQNESDMANDNPLQKTDSFVNLLKGDQTVQPEQKKQGGNIIEDFLGGLGKAVGGIAKVGAAVVAPTAVNAFYNQRQKMAEDKLGGVAKEYMAQHQGEDVDINTVINHLKQNYPDDFKYADLSRVYDSVQNSIEPILQFEKSKMLDRNLYNDKFYEAWSHDKLGFEMRDGGQSSLREIKVGQTKLKEMMESLGLKFLYKDDDPKTGDPTFELSKDTPMTQDKMDQIFRWVKENRIPNEFVRRAFDLRVEKPDYKMLDLEYKNNRLSFEKAKDDLKRRTGRDITYNQWLSAVDKAIKLRQTDASGTVGDTAFDDQVAQLLGRDLSSVAGYVPLTEVDKKEIQKYDSEFTAALNDADALSKSFSSFKDAPEFGVNQFMNESGTLPVMPQGYYTALENGDTVLASKYQQIHDKVATAIGNRNRRIILLKNKKKTGGDQSSPTGFSAKDLIATGKWTQQLLDMAVKQGKLNLNKDGTYSQ